jgi:DNA processing protein
MATGNLLYRIAITLIPGVGDVLAKNLISYCGSAEAVFKQKKSHLLKIPGIGTVTADSIVKHKEFGRAEAEIKFIEKNKIIPLFYLDENFPKRLQHCADSPVMLYYKGSANLNCSRILAIVGTRSATEYGKNFCEKLLNDLAALNVTVVSGLAYGIDICAHKASLKNNIPTVGVLGHGLDRIYPFSHRSTAEKMIHNGGLLTEFLKGTNPDKENFPKRNRIVAGLSDAVIVVEAARSGGALITAEIANSYNRDVFAVPGKVDDAFSQGCNRLIKTNKAALLESAADLVYIMGWEEEKKKGKPNNQQKLFIELNAEEKIIVGLLTADGKMDVDTLSLKSNLPLSKVAAGLLNLEFAGMVKSLPGKIYQLA